MNYLDFILPLGMSFLLGLLLVRYLTVHPLKMSGNLFLSTIFLFSTLVLIVVSFNTDLIALMLASGLSLIAFIGGYAIMSTHVLGMEDPRHIPEINRAKDDPGKGHTAVVYFTHGEPETYHPIGWINQFKEFDEQNIPFVPFLIRPLFLYQLRKKYLQVGKSDHRKMHHIMITDLEKAFRKENDTSTKFYLSFLDDEPRPDAALIQALNEGASKIIISEVFVSVSNHTAEGEELIKSVKAENYGVTLEFTEPLWNSETLHRMFLESANHVIENPKIKMEKSKVGILLVGHGQPDEWDVEFPTETEHELLFRERILDLFRADGYKNVGLAWMEFKSPKPAEQIREFVRNGVETILFFSAAISADAIHSQYDIPELVYQTKVPDHIRFIDMGAWNNHHLAIQAIKERIKQLM